MSIAVFKVFFALRNLVSMAKVPVHAVRVGRREERRC
jgi:hypothetical protein